MIRVSSRFAVVPAAYVILRRNDEILLQQRRNTGFRDGFWATAAAGHVERGEAVVDAAVREAREELGVDVDRAAVRMLGLGWDLARLRPEVCVALALDAVPGSAGGEEFDVVEAFDAARPPAPLTPGAACALALLGTDAGRPGRRAAP